LDFELRVLHFLSKFSTTWAMPLALFALVYFQVGFTLLPSPALDLNPHTSWLLHSRNDKYEPPCLEIIFLQNRRYDSIAL
jgi:hypothetical protein